MKNMSLALLIEVHGNYVTYVFILSIDCVALWNSYYLVRVHGTTVM